MKSYCPICNIETVVEKKCKCKVHAKTIEFISNAEGEDYWLCGDCGGYIPDSEIQNHSLNQE